MSRPRRDTRERWRLIIRRLDGSLTTIDAYRGTLEAEMGFQDSRIAFETCHAHAGVAWYRELRA